MSGNFAIKGGGGQTPNGKCHFKFPFWFFDSFPKGRNDTKRQNVFSWHSSKASLVKNDHIHAWAPISMSPLDADALLQHIDKSLSNVPPLRNSNPPQSMVYVPAIYAFCFLNYHCYCFFSLSLSIILFYLSLSRHSWVAMLTRAWFTWEPYLIYY